MRSESVVSVLIHTWKHVLLMFCINLLSVLPIYWIIKLGLHLARDVLGIKWWFTDLMFVYCCIAVFAAYLAGIKKYFLHLTKGLHIASVTNFLIVGKPLGIRASIAACKGRFLYWHAMLAMSGLVRICLNEVGSWIRKDSKFLPKFVKEGVLSRLVGNVISDIMLTLDEVLISYTLLHKEKRVFTCAAEALSVYIRDWKTILKGTLVNILLMRTFRVILDFLVAVLCFITFFKYNWQSALFVGISYKVLKFLITMALYEPYKYVTMLLNYYEMGRQSEAILGLEYKLEEVSRSVNRSLLLHRRAYGDSINDLKDLVISNLSSNDETIEFFKTGSNPVREDNIDA